MFEGRRDPLGGFALSVAASYGLIHGVPDRPGELDVDRLVVRRERIVWDAGAPRKEGYEAQQVARGVSGLPAPSSPRAGAGRLPLDVQGLGGGRLRGVGRVLPEACLQISDPPLEGSDQGEHGDLDVGGRLGPEVRGDRRGRAHASGRAVGSGWRQSLHP
jgi:hypothetical protein